MSSFEDDSGGGGGGGGSAVNGGVNGGGATTTQQQHQQQQQQMMMAQQDEAIRRVKVYELNEESGQWEDKGTGSVCCTYVESKGGLCIVVYPEHQEHGINKPLMQTLLSYDDIYRQQQGTSFQPRRKHFFFFFHLIFFFCRPFVGWASACDL
jgi:hypothetical protein